MPLNSDSPSITTTKPSNAPIRVGIVGMGRLGTFQLERLSLRDDCQAVAACDRASDKRSNAASFGCRFFQDWPAFLAEAETDVILIATPAESRYELALAALTARRHVLVESPLCQQPHEVDVLFDVAARAGCLLQVVRLRGGNSGFRTALAVLKSGELGELQSLTLTDYHYGAAPAAGDSSNRQVTDGTAATAMRATALDEFGPGYFDELLQFVRQSPISVYATTATAAETSTSAATPGAGFVVVVQFANHLRAVIDVNTRSTIPHCTGWVLAGSQGGYRHLRRYTKAADTEIYETPVARLASQQDLHFDELVARLRHPQQISADRLHAQRVVTLFDAARRSADSGEVVRL